MMVSVETYLRRSAKGLRRLAQDPWVRRAGRTAAYLAGGFVLSAAAVRGGPLPLALGMICTAARWPAALMALGAAAGYPSFWGDAGGQGIVWAAAGALLAAALDERQERLEQPLMLPAIAAAMTAVTGLCFRLILGEDVPLEELLLRVGAAFFSAMLFAQARLCRDAVTDWLLTGVGVLALARTTPVPWLGCAAAGLLAVGGAFPAAVLAGVGLDLAGTLPVSMTAVQCLAGFAGMIPFQRRWQRCAVPAAAYLAVCWLSRVWQPLPAAALAIGGGLGAVLPLRPRYAQRRGATGAAQVRLELASEVLGTVQNLLLQVRLPPVDQEALLDKVRTRACGRCAARRTCADRDRLEPELLAHPLDADCPRPGRLVPELRRARDQLRLMGAQRCRQQECLWALAQQYRFLAGYLRTLADGLPRGAEQGAVRYRVEVAARSRGKERANGDKCLAFPGPGACYYVLLCDGMGTGLGAAQAGQEVSALLRQMLTAGFPAEHALSAVNSILALEDRAGMASVDLAQVRLDTGLARVYKWGAAPSWVLSRAGAEKIGTATPPPGISAHRGRETVEKLSLRRGEVLILLSDGVDGEAVQRLSDLTPDMPPGELAAKILASGRGPGDDDATAAAIRLRPTGLDLS